MRIFFISIILIATIGFTQAQSFEGWITYKAVALNPNPKMIPDSTWKEQLEKTFGERGHMIQKYYYKEGTYFSEVDAGNESGFQVFDPRKKLLYSWQENSDTAVVVNVTSYMDEVNSITHSDETEEILGIECTKVVIDSKFGKTTLWYNSDHFKMDPALAEGHKYGNWEAIMNAIGCLPLKMEVKGFMTHMIQEATAYSAEEIDDQKFVVPQFKGVIENPF